MDDRMIASGLFELQDEGYRVFQAKLMPNISCDRIIGVRTPDLRSYAKKILAGSGICGIAVISAIYDQGDIKKAAENLKNETCRILAAEITAEKNN